MKQINNKVIRLMLVLLLNFLPLCLFAQVAKDVIYTSHTGAMQSKIKSISSEQILLSNNRSVSLSDLKMAVKSNGDILLPVKDEVGFRTIKNEKKEYDRIITRDQEIFAAKAIDYSYLSVGRIGYEDFHNRWFFNVDTADIVMILQRDGSHKLYNQEIAPSKIALLNDLSSFVSREPRLNIELSEAEQKNFKYRAEKNVRAFGEYLSQITSPDTDELDQERYKELALALFVNEFSTVQISSLNSDIIRSLGIKQYLGHITSLRYARVELLWSNVAFVNNLRKGSDGLFYGVISIQQIFKGYNSDNMVEYQDITNKNVEVVLKPIKQYIEGNEVNRWEVFLSNVMVESTT